VVAIVADGIACAQAGACIIHVHAYDGGGPQTFDWQVYARIIDPSADPAERARLEQALVAYCERDTLALTRLVEYFERQ